MQTDANVTQSYTILLESYTSSVVIISLAYCVYM